MRLQRGELITPQMRRWGELTISRVGRQHPMVSSPRRRRLVLVHLDGVPRSLLERAIATGAMPFFSKLVRSGAYHFDGAFWGSPASTPAFQAGALYGLRHPNLPAYHWYDRDLGREIHMNKPKDAIAIEDRLIGMRSGSLLEGGGTTYLSLFRADASNDLCMTGLGHPKQLAASLRSDVRGIRGTRRQTVPSYLSGLFRDTCGAGLDVVRWARGLGDWRHEREYMLNRLFLLSLGWQLALNRALIDMIRGVPAMYLVFGNFDEVAHRRGPFSEQAAHELLRLDTAIEELYTIAKLLTPAYDVVFVTDHGHVDSDPLEARIGMKLKPYLIESPPPGMPEAVERGLRDGRDLPVVRPLARRDEPVVIEAGNFAHVYLTRRSQPLEALELLTHHRDELARAVAQKDIGIIAVRRRDEGVAIIRGQVYAASEVDRSPLASQFSRRAVADLLRELPHMPHAGDLVLYGEAHLETGTVGFAWEFGSHGGLTRIETDSVVCWPSDAGVDLGSMTHSVELHQRLSAVYRQ